MTARLTTLAAALLGGLALAAAPALAQSFPRSVETPAATGQSYPRTYGSGENIMVDYGPNAQAMLVGGGRVVVTQVSGMNVEIMHLDAMFVQSPREGFVPLTFGSGESAETIWVPAAMVQMFRIARGGRPVR
jgi:hypothetical protein